MEEPAVLNNIIDICLAMEEDPGLSGRGDLMFRRLLSTAFFSREAEDSRAMAQLLEELVLPQFIRDCPSLLKLETDRLEVFVNGETMSDSLAGRIMLTKTYLKIAYPHHPPAFNSLPEDVRMELTGRVRARNECVIDSFKKMAADIEADRSRRILTLVALVLANIHRKSGIALQKLNRPAGDVIGEMFPGSGDVFRASREQMALILEDGRVRDTIKNFFVVRQFADMTELTDHYRKEIERYRRRALRAFQ